MMFLVGKYKGEGNMEINALESCDLAPSGIQNHTTIVQGNVSDPSYAPGGAKVAYVMQDGGHQAIFVAGSDGSGAKNISGAAGDFASPLFSPQFK
jgi:Tol biopolymer transport system component